MRQYFSDYYRPRTKDEVDTLFKTAIFSFDTSVILELFVLSDAARESWLQILNAIESDRLWLTYQAAREYHVNVDLLIKEQCESTAMRVQQRFDLAKQADLQSFIDKNEFFLGQDSKAVLNDFAAVFKTQSKALSKKTNELKKSYLIQCERTKVRIADLFDSRVTPVWNMEKLLSEHQIAEIRRRQAIPPGYMDFEKSTNVDGDYFVWRQLIDLAIDKKRPIIFVTKDLKEDWFTPSIKEGDARTPRSELRQEMLTEAKQEFMLFSFHDFFEEAKKRFGIETTEAVSDEVKKAELAEIPGGMRSVLPLIIPTFRESSFEDLVERIYSGGRSRLLGQTREQIVQSLQRDFAHMLFGFPERTFDARENESVTNPTDEKPKS